MATRTGATKTVGGKRYRYNGTKWIQIKATGNVTPTSSRNRSARSNRSNATVTNDSNRQRRGGVRTTTDTQRTSTGSAKVTTKPKALPPGTKGGSLATTKGPRRRNVNSNPPSSGTRAARGGLPPQLRGVLEAKGVLPPGKKGGEMSGSNRPRRRNVNKNPSSGKTQTGSQSPASIKREQAAVRRAQAEIGRKRMGPLSAVAEMGLGALLKPVAETVGYQGGKLLRKAVGGGDPKLDKKGKPIKSSSPSTSQSRRKKEEQYNRAVGAARRVVKPSPAASTPSTPSRPTGGAGRGRSGGPGPKPLPKTGANDPRNAAYIAARSKLNSSSTKAERDKVRDMGMEIHNKAFGKKSKTSPAKSQPTKTSAAQNLKQGRSPDPKKKKKKVLPYFGGNGIGRY